MRCALMDGCENEAFFVRNEGGELSRYLKATYAARILKITVITGVVGEGHGR